MSFRNIWTEMGKRDKQYAISRAVSVTESSDTLRSICEDSSILKPYVTPGLGAFANNDRKKIKVPSTSLLNCSVNLDEASRMSHPHENRWDYALDYDGKAFFIEIHPAHTSEIECMVKKVLFVKKWLTSVAPEILRLPGTREFYWVSSGTTDLRIMKNSPQARKLALHKIVSVGQVWDYWKVCT